MMNCFPLRSCDIVIKKMNPPPSLRDTSAGGGQKQITTIHKPKNLPKIINLWKVLNKVILIY